MHTPPTSGNLAMIPALTSAFTTLGQHSAFCQALSASSFKGDIHQDESTRTALSTDNSIYQMTPQAVLYPKDKADIALILSIAAQPEFRSVALCARGGGTGTNGQSLTNSVVVDTSKHMNQILEVNLEEGWARVECGVVKDQLNALIEPHGWFFAPELSTSNRATIGGMINTDASGQGSCKYGKTRDHVLELTSVFLDGTEWTSSPVTAKELTEICNRDDRVGEVHRLIDSIDREHKHLIAEKFPPLNRCLTGYDLAHIRDKKNKFNLNNILCGSEGTLGMIVEAKINLLRIPAHSAIVNVYYRDFNSALRDATTLLKSKPTSIETIDSRVLNLAMQDSVWHGVADYFPAPENGEKIQGVNLVEFTADDETELKNLVEQFTTKLAKENKPSKSSKKESNGRIGNSIAWGQTAVNKIWGMRKKSVGLLGNLKGDARPIPFVEDTAVPPEHLADYILEFRKILDSHHLIYGMFGHVDAGVLHVRPAINMRDPEQEKLVRVISDQVAALTKKYNGLLWGEHGKGVRSEYAPTFFGELYPQIQRVKGAFDPFNQLNPGKIATPISLDGAQLLKIDEVPTRGQTDRNIPVEIWDAYEEAVHCNGNGLCYNWNPNEAMCPSWKATRNRVYSPKGRAALMREWLLRLTQQNADPVKASQQIKQSSFLVTLPKRLFNSYLKWRGNYDFSHQVQDAMSTCLACKSCAGSCPIKVDVPEFRSKFLEIYYGRYLRPLKDYFVGGLEFVLPSLARLPRVYNGLISFTVSKWMLKHLIGIVDSPLLSTKDFQSIVQEHGIAFVNQKAIEHMTAEEKKVSVIFVQDAFTQFFDTQVVIDCLVLLKSLGFNPLIAAFHPNGKPLHVHGFLGKFFSTAKKNADYLNKLSQSDIPLIGLDPAMTLAYRGEYQRTLGKSAPNVLLIQEWLALQHEILLLQRDRFKSDEYLLLAHCTEKTNAVASLKDWQSIFKSFSQNLKIIEVGCCGMSGTFGHETNNQKMSHDIYEMSWAEAVRNPDNEGKMMATGYSCRSQVKRMDSVSIPHPTQVLLKILTGDKKNAPF